MRITGTGHAGMRIDTPADDDGTLTCQLHGWKFDLASGRCLTSVGHKLPAPSA